MSFGGYSHSSDLSQSVITLSRRSDLIGYRNVLSYASALGLPIFPENAVELDCNPIGQGSRSVTLRGTLHEPGRDRVVAVKQPNTSFTRDKAEEEESIQHLGLSSIIQEVRILADPKLRSHPNLPHVIGAFFQYETTPEGIRPCVIFELATSDFASFVRARSQADGDSKDILKACSQIANGLCALHAYGLVHGDIKLENILMFERDGEVVATVADLGTCGTPSQEEIITGTRVFWAPELHFKSQFRALANHPSRDIYSFGLLTFAAATRYRERPFPSDISEQFEIQHSEESCLERLLSKMSQDSDADVAFREAVRLCVRVNPAERPSIYAVADMMEKAIGQSKSTRIMQDVAEGVFLTDPMQPRLNILEQMPLPEHLRSKLQAEFLILARDSPSVRTALTLAAFYRGVFGEKTGSGRNVIAETQWLLKAVELGSHATLNAYAEKDGSMSKALGDYGSHILELRGPDFQSPEIDVRKLHLRLEEFSKMGNDEVPGTILQILTTTPGREENKRGSRDDVHAEEATTAASDSPTRKRDDFLRRLTLGRDFDLDLFDSGAMDLQSLTKDALHKSAFNDDLETFMILSQEAQLTSGSERIRYYASLAVFNGSVRVVSYLADHFQEGPNEAWESTTHFEDSILFGHGKIARMYLEKGAELVPYHCEQPSIFHYLIGHEDVDLARLCCAKLNTQGDLARVLNWKPTGGQFAGNTPLRVAVSSRAWKLSRLYIELGADIDLECSDGPILQSILNPQSPSPPIELLISVINRGADLNAVTEGSHPALEWPVFTSNVLAVQELLLRGAEPVLSEEYDYFKSAEEMLEERLNQSPVNVVDEDGQVVEESWASAVAAGKLVVEIIGMARSRHPGWEDQMQQLVHSEPRDCLSKYWLVVGEGSEMGAIEVHFSLHV